MIAERDRPRVITLDSGTGCTSYHFEAWGYARKIHPDIIRPGRPVENNFIESFSGKLRDES